jgi:uncharacterized protein YhdP
VRLKLALPISQIERSKVQGSVLFSGGNELRVVPQSPQLSRLRGSVAFSETGFQLNAVQARALGGDVRLEGACARRRPRSRRAGAAAARQRRGSAPRAAPGR